MLFVHYLTKISGANHATTVSLTDMVGDVKQFRTVDEQQNTQTGPGDRKVFGVRKSKLLIQQTFPAFQSYFASSKRSPVINIKQGKYRVPPRAPWINLPFSSSSTIATL